MVGMTIDEWLRIGFDNGWVGPIVCDTHDGLPLTQEESDALWTGDEPCVSILRVYASPEEKRLVEEHHSPSVWRAENER